MNKHAMIPRLLLPTLQDYPGFRKVMLVAFQEAYPGSSFLTVTRDNFLDFVG
ncbi:MAG: hypothetical protein IPK21_23235 [Haliscomenobacter sp.]|nr:hypothetical protein [Haliscomenobacter sp.]